MVEQLQTIHLKNFNDRVKAMSQTNSRDLTMSAQDARSLQADIFNLMTIVVELSAKLSKEDGVVQISLDGGAFK
jgi:hypothetical protein